MPVRLLVSPLRLAALLVLSGCVMSPARYDRPVPSSAQAVSLLGDTLWTIPIEPAWGPRRIADLQYARERLEDDPSSVNRQILVAQRTAAVGQFREAIRIYTYAMGTETFDPRLLRGRGELLLQIREVDRAVRDLRRAAQLALGEERALGEYADAPDGTGVVVSSVQFNAVFQLGLALYIRGDFDEAYGIFLEAVRRATTPDDQARTALWLFFASRRTGRTDAAATLLRGIPANMGVRFAQPEYDLLRVYGGQLPQDSLPVKLGDSIKTPAEALYAYGLGFALLMYDRTEEAREVFQTIRGIADWSSIAYLAAEAELARLVPGRRSSAGSAR